MSLSFRFVAILLFLSAFLLFFIQPLASRIILPVLGGTPIVWTTSMLFFQTLLLGGYLWAHIMIRYMPVWVPPLLQTLIAGVTIFFIDYETPLTFSADQDHAVWWQFKTLFLMIGLPYFALATNSPLYQAVYKEFKTGNSSKTPYALYSISNIGSFVALLGYPFVVEPLLSLDVQASLWRYGYIALSCIIALSGFMCLTLFLKRSTVKVNNKTVSRSNRSQSKPTLSMMALWCLIAFIPSCLMLSVTTYVTTDVASIPLLWLIPLAFYLASFIMAFAEPPLWLAKNDRTLDTITFISLILLFNFLAISLNLFGWVEMVLHYVNFLFVATACHLKLSKLKPAPEHLTLFYFIISVGGCLGGLFNALVFPHVFVIPVEYILTLLLFVSLCARYPEVFDKKTVSKFDIGLVAIIALAYAYIHLVMTRELSFILSIAIVFVLLMAYYIDNKRIILILAALCCLGYTNSKLEQTGTAVYMSRNVFGSLMIKDVPEQNARYLLHGTTLHGIQPLPLTDDPKIISYYYRTGPIGDVFRILDNRPGEQHIAGLGLGLGTVACYKKEQRHYRFFEINPEVVDLALNEEYFTYLSSCAPDVPIIIGDARISMIEEEKQNHRYDLVFVDTFSSDSIPVHLITKEAVDIYERTLKENGIILFHISNRYFDLVPVLAGIAKENGLFYASRFHDKEDISLLQLKTSYLILTKDKDVIDRLTTQDGWKVLEDDKKLPLWTDDYVNVLGVLKH